MSSLDPDPSTTHASGNGPGGRTTLLTVGHGTADQDALVALLRSSGVEHLVDIRRFPGSRRHPHTAREAMEQWLPEAGIDYRWEARLGGRRRAEPDSPDRWWQVEAFRAYAAHTRSEEFVEALRDLLVEATAARTAVLCSESLWWRCHRRLVADVAVLLHGVDVQHLTHDGRTSAHRASAGARVTDAGLVYDAVPPDADDKG